MLAPGGRFVALERRITDPGASGHAGQGWTQEQANAFAEHCRRVGFTNVTADEHAGRRGALVSVVASRPDD